MTGRFETFDPPAGGSSRLVLTCANRGRSQPKSSEDSDVVDVRYLETVPDDRIVQAVDFVADDPELAGTMTMSWTLREEDDGTYVENVAEDVPGGI